MGRGHRARLASLVVGIVAATLIVVFALRTTSSSTVTPSTLGGKLAPAIVGQNAISGAPLSLRALHGRYVVVDFFASWCGTCITEEPQVEAFTRDERNDPRVGFIGVDIDDTLTNARLFLSNYHATWPAVVDAAGTIAQSYGIANPPELFLVDPSGKIVSSITDQAVTTGVLDHWVHGAELARA